MRRAKTHFKGGEIKMEILDDKYESLATRKTLARQASFDATPLRSEGFLSLPRALTDPAGLFKRAFSAPGAQYETLSA